MTVPGLSALEELAELQLEAQGVPPWRPLPHQVIPEDDDSFFLLLEAGRGAGKTATASHYLRDHLNGPPCINPKLPHRAALIAPTLGDAIESAVLTDMALVRLNPLARFTQAPGGSMVRWPGGSQVRLFGAYTAEDVERLRAGGNRCIVWAEELATWRHLIEAWELMMLGLRLGPLPRVVATTTPKARPEYKTLREQADRIINATTRDNPNLNPEQKERLYALYEGTSIGKQELAGELIDEAEGAIWDLTLIEQSHRYGLLDRPDDLDDDDEWDPHGRGVVAVDPPGGATECGIVAAVRLNECPCRNDRPLPHFGVLLDQSGKLSPDGWSKRTVGTYHDLELDRVVGESNYGGDMVEATIRNVDKSVSYKSVRASRGKRIRAEPVKALYEQDRVHHLRPFPELEAEMVQWVPDESSWSPNRLDALVWALTELSGGMILDGALMA